MGTIRQQAWKILELILPQLAAVVVRQKLIKRESALADEDLRLEGFELDEPALQAALAELKAEYEREEDRRNRLSEKARAALLIIGVVVALVSSSPAFVNSSGIWIHELVLLVFTVVTFALSAVTLTMAVDVRAWHGLYLDSKFIRKDNVLSVEPSPPRQEILDLYVCWKLNHSVLSDVGNLVSTSYLGIRNGILSLACLFLLVILRLAVPVPSASISKSSFHQITTLSEAKEIIAKNQTTISRVTIPAGRTIVLHQADGTKFQYSRIGMVLEMNEYPWYVLPDAVAEGLLNDSSQPLSGISIRIEK